MIIKKGNHKLSLKRKKPSKVLRVTCLNNKEWGAMSLMYVEPAEIFRRLQEKKQGWPEIYSINHDTIFIYPIAKQQIKLEIVYERIHVA